jgi:hypothetical protein
MAQQPNNVPSIDPANEDNLPGLFRHVFNKLMQGVDGMLPARVVAFNNDRDKPRVTVQPLIAIVTTGDEQVARAQVASLPVFQFGAGGYLLSFPIKTGDLGWILASDRDISIFLQSHSASRPQTFRKQNFADALFIPDVMTGYTVNPEDLENPVFQKADGSVRLALWPEFAKITAPRGLGVNTQPHEAVIFKVASTTKASHPFPNMTDEQMLSIVDPQDGDYVWNTTHRRAYHFHTGNWSPA